MKDKVEEAKVRMERMQLKTHKAAMALELCFLPSARCGSEINALTKEELEQGSMRCGMCEMQELHNTRGREQLVCSTGHMREGKSEFAKLVGM